MSCCWPKPKPRFGDKHVDFKTKNILPRFKSCYELDETDRGTQISVFVGPTHKVFMNVLPTTTVKRIIETVEGVCGGEAYQAMSDPSKEGWCWEGEPLKVTTGTAPAATGLIHRHQLPLYNDIKQKKHTEELYTLEPLAEAMMFGKIEIGTTDIKTFELVGALESVHFLMLTAEFPEGCYVDMEHDPSVFFADSMGMEEDVLYWAQDGNYMYSFDDPIDSFGLEPEVSLELEDDINANSADNERKGNATS